MLVKLTEAQAAAMHNALEVYCNEDMVEAGDDDITPGMLNRSKELIELTSAGILEFDFIDEDIAALRHAISCNLDNMCDIGAREYDAWQKEEESTVMWQDVMDALEQVANLTYMRPA